MSEGRCPYCLAHSRSPQLNFPFIGYQCGSARIVGAPVLRSTNCASLAHLRRNHIRRMIDAAVFWQCDPERKPDQIARLERFEAVCRQALGRIAAAEGDYGTTEAC